MRKVHTKPQIKTGKKVNLLRIIILFVIACILGLISYYAFTVYTIKLFDPTKVNGSHQYLLSQTDNDTKKTLVVIESGSGTSQKISEIYLFSTNKEKGETVLVYIPNWLYWTGLEGDFGNSIAVASFKYAGDFLQEGRGVEYAIWQIGQMLGVKVDDYIWFTPQGYDNYVQIYGDISTVSERLKGNFESPDDDVLSEAFFRLSVMSSKYASAKDIFNISGLKNFKDTIYSNLGFTGILSFFSNLDQIVENTETYGIDLSYSRYSTEDLSTNGGQIRYIDTSEFDAVYRNLISKIIDRSIEKEQVRIEVYNGSGISGVAQQFGRKIENSGCNVVRYENAPKTIDKTIVYITNKGSFENSLAVVSEVLSGSYDIVEGRPDFMTTGDIVVVLGEDIQQMYSF